jgi:hypothetical protein
MTGISTGSSGNRAYYGGAALALLTAFLIVWTKIVQDDGNANGSFMLILAVGVGGSACEFGRAGMARTMVGVAIMQLLLGMLIATAPITAAAADGIFKAVAYNCIAAASWLLSAMLFRAAAKNACRAINRAGEFPLRPVLFQPELNNADFRSPCRPCRPCRRRPWALRSLYLPARPRWSLRW